MAPSPNLASKSTDRAMPLGGRGNRFRRHGLSAAAAGLATSAIADPASATIIYDLAVSASTGSSFQIGGTAAGQLDLVSANMGMAGLDMALFAPGGSTVQLSTFDSGMIGMTDWLSLFNGGDSVGASLTYDNPAYLVDNSNTNPSWAAGSTGYAGFVFDTGSGPFYGWLQVQFDASTTNFTVLQWAYDNTPNTAIEVGAVPEPTTALLLGLGLAGFAAVGIRRGTKAVDPPKVN